jgi:hypothetical protein
MDDNVDYFGVDQSFVGHTTLNPIAAVAFLVMALAMLALPRRFAVLPMIIMACFISPAQRIVIASLNFDMLRLMVMVGWLRLLLRNEATGLKLKPIDYALVLWAATMTIIDSIRSEDPRAMVYMLGLSFDCVGLYFLFRFLIRDWVDMHRITMCFAAISVPVSAAFFLEHETGHNVFAVFGYVPPMTLVREGHLRCQGAFPHPIIAGCFWATLMPFMAVYAIQRKPGRYLAMTGLFCSSLIILWCNSSTPVMAVFCGIAGGLAFFIRPWIRTIRWTILVGLCILQMVLKHPVWHLLVYLDFAGGSTGWDRYYLIDQAIHHFGDWWLAGVDSTATWNLFDIVNEYVYYGIEGGLLTMLLFISVIWLGFRGVSAAMRDRRIPTEQKIVVWAMGIALFQHMADFFAVYYFQQIILVWYLLLAMIATVTPTSSPASANVRRVQRLRGRRQVGIPVGGAAQGLTS